MFKCKWEPSESNSRSLNVSLRWSTQKAPRQGRHCESELMVSSAQTNSPPLRLIYSPTSNSSDDFIRNDRWKVINRLFLQPRWVLTLVIDCGSSRYAADFCVLLDWTLSTQVCYIMTGGLWRYHTWMETTTHCGTCSHCPCVPVRRSEAVLIWYQSWLTVCDVMSLPVLYETNPSITETNRLHVSAQRQKEVHVEHLLN